MPISAHAVRTGARSSPRAGRLAGVMLVVLAAAPLSLPAQVSDGQRFKNWAARCEQVNLPDGQVKEQCYVFQTLAHKETQKPLLNVAVGYVAETQKPAAIFTLPLGIFLPPGVAVKIDQNEPFRMPIQLCTQEGCRGVLELTADVLNKMKAGNTAQVAFFDARRQEVVVPISLLGFTAGFNSLQ